MLRKFLKNMGGNIALSTAIMAVPVLGGAGVAVDYISLSRAETVLQNAVDSAALASAKELGLTNSNGGEIEDSSGRRVFGRLTEAASTWTLSFFVNISGTETAHSLSSQDIKFLYREVFDQNNRPTIGANVGAFDTLSAISFIV